MGSVAHALTRPLRDNMGEVLREPSLPREWYDALEEAGTQFLVWTWLKGREHVLREAPAAIRPEEVPADFADFEVSFENIPFTEAIEALRARVPVGSETFRQMEAALRFRAFTAAHLAGQDALARLQDIFVSNLEEGEGLSGFLERVGADELLQRSGFAETNPYYLENVYRTNATAAYNAGRRQQFRETGGIELLEYVGISDRRQTDICRSYDGLRRPVDDPIWDTITPPNHFSCRSTVRAIFRGTPEAGEVSPTSETEVESRLEEHPPDEGFEAAPSTAEEIAQLPDDVRERARQYGILGAIEDRRAELEL